MAYSPSKTWSSSDTLLAQDLLTNIDEIQEYLEKIEDSAIQTTPWLDTAQIATGYYEPVVNRHTFVSGVSGGNVYTVDKGDITYATRDNTLKLGSNIYKEIPRTTVQFELGHPAPAVLFQYWICPLTQFNDDGTLDYSDIFIRFGSVGNEQVTSRHRSYEEDTATAGYPYREDRYFGSGSDLQTNLGVGTYEFGLSAASETSKTRIIAWGISFQAWHF